MVNYSCRSQKLDYNNRDLNENQNLIPENSSILLHVAAFSDALDCFRYLQLSPQILLRKQSSSSFLPLHNACLSGASKDVLYTLAKLFLFCLFVY